MKLIHQEDRMLSKRSRSSLGWVKWHGLPSPYRCWWWSCLGSRLCTKWTVFRRRRLSVCFKTQWEILSNPWCSGSMDRHPLKSSIREQSSCYKVPWDFLSSSLCCGSTDSQQLIWDRHGKSQSLVKFVLRERSCQKLELLIWKQGQLPASIQWRIIPTDNFPPRSQPHKNAKDFHINEKTIPQNASHSTHNSFLLTSISSIQKMIQNHKTVLTICACWKMKKLFHCSPAIHTKLPNKYSTFCIHHICHTTTYSIW